MKKIFYTIAAIGAIFGLGACAPESDNYNVNRYLCNFEGDYWDALVDTNPNGDNLLNGSISPIWHDGHSDLMGKVSQPFEGYWEGVALSNHCSTDYAAKGSPRDQLYAYTDAAYSGRNFIICNAFMDSPFLAFDSKRSYIESMQIALTTYSYNATMYGNHLTPPITKEHSIWVEAVGYTIEDGVEREEATTKFYLYENGQPAFTGWKKIYFSSMSKVDKIVFNIKWNGNGFLPYPAYFAIDDIVVVRQERMED
jgi:hypothetical protein